METETKTFSEQGAATEHPEDLWLDPDIEPGDLIRLDRLAITEDIVEQAEHPELANPYLHKLPP